MNALSEHSASGKPLTDRLLKNLPHLNAMITETLRLHPPVPSVLPRLTPRAGLIIGSAEGGPGQEPLMVPPKTEIWMPQYVMGRSKSSTFPIIVAWTLRCWHIDNALYVEPYTFLPSRWTTDTNHLIQDQEGVRDSYAPFSIGRYGCIGRPLALMNIRLTMARIVHEYEISPLLDDPSYVEGSNIRNTTEGFTMRPGVIRLRLTRRKRY